jgi:hypothetical protein
MTIPPFSNPVVNLADCILSRSLSDTDAELLALTENYRGHGIGTLGRK